MLISKGCYPGMSVRKDLLQQTLPQMRVWLNLIESGLIGMKLRLDNLTSNEQG